MKSFQEFTLYIFQERNIFSQPHCSTVYIWFLFLSYKMHFDDSKGVFPRDRNYFFLYHDKSGIISKLTSYHCVNQENLFLFRGIHPPIISWRIPSKREPFVLSNHSIDWLFSLRLSFSWKTSYIPLSLYTFIPSLFNLSTVSYA